MECGLRDAAGCKGGQSRAVECGWKGSKKVAALSGSMPAINCHENLVVLGRFEGVYIYRLRQSWECMIQE